MSEMKPHNNSNQESFGQAILAMYKPFITVSDSKRPNARSNRLYGYKTQRVHQFLSDNEKRYFRYLEWADNVYDIREQFPLNQDETLAIAERYGIKHPAYKGKNIIMTTDFVVTLTDGRTIARAFKETSSLDNKRVLAKLSIEKEYWESKGVHWGIIHEKLVDNIFAENVEEFLICKSLLSEIDIEEEAINNLINLIKHSHKTLSDVFMQNDEVFSLASGTSNRMFKFLVAEKKLLINMKKRYSAFMNCSEIRFCDGG